MGSPAPLSSPVPRSHPLSGQHCSVIFQPMGPILLKLLTYAFNSLDKFSFSDRILITFEKERQRFRRLKDFGRAAPEEKRLSGDTTLPHSEPTFPVISALIFKILWAAQFNVQQARWAELLFLPPARPVVTLCNSLICGIFTYNFHNLYFSSSGLQVPFKMLLPSVMLLKPQSGDL